MSRAASPLHRVGTGDDEGEHEHDRDAGERGEPEQPRRARTRVRGDRRFGLDQDSSNSEPKARTPKAT